MYDRSRNKFVPVSKSRYLIPLAMWAASLFMAGWVVFGYLIILLHQELPDATSIRNVELKVPLRVYSSDNLLISEFGDERRKPIEIADVPPALIDAVLASEDDNFYNHSGIDFFGLVRATLANMRAGGASQGASTITMQVARNFFLSFEKTYTRKIKEILLAIKLEQILTKDEILSLYLNKIFLGHRSYGFGAAAEVYYGKPLEELNVAQFAMLAGLPKAPSSFNPLRNPVRAVQRRDYVLGRMHDLDKISDEEYELALAAPVTAEKHATSNSLTAPHIAEMVRAQLVADYGEDAYWSGLSVYTTVRSELQRKAEISLREGLHSYDRRHGFRGPIAKVSLTRLEVDLSAPSLAYEQALEEIPSSREQVPALVLDTAEESAQVYVKGVGLKTLDLEHARWARRYKTADLLGDGVVDMRNLVSAGDVVYVMPRELSEDELAAIAAETAKQAPTSDNSNDTSSADANTNEQHTVEYKLSQLPNVSGALISIEPGTGKILSLAGGYDFFLNKYNRAIQSIRQPGSNIKPFIYSASLDKGFTPASLISGAPIVMTDPAHGTVWRPENYSGKFYGPTRMREALGQSMNLVSIRLLRSIGIAYARDYTARFGIDMSRFSPTLTMALGSGGVTPLELLSAYGVLANGGYRVEPYFIDRIEDRDGRIIYRADQAVLCDECYDQFLPFPEVEIIEDEVPLDAALIDEQVQEVEPAPEPDINEPNVPTAIAVTQNYDAPRVMSRANNFLTTSMMKDVIRRGTGRKALALERMDLAGKTGTTNDYVDAWFTGFNSKVATTVWIGFDDPETLGRGEAGSRTALPVWVDYMSHALQGVAEDPQVVPPYIEEGFVHRETGARTVEEDPAAVPEYFALEPLQPEIVVANRLREQGLDAPDADGFGQQNEYGDSEQPLYEQYLDEYQDESMPDSTEPVQPEEKIIETEEETEGLF